ncbi:MAG: type II toxin-antitoxin system VapC family toxin [Desulfobacteraceae bacterium]|nr:type II toxin-antitoxin system VapC family toxin [Desulfobacteraceae bacterium]MBC2755557.1 type II toxin-antitoxin system VapC family toxin [Desulfobacteraceae bacterium]
MILVDTSVWINHLRDGDRYLEELLLDGEVWSHTFIISELACGNIKNRKEIISLLLALPMSPQVEFREYLYFIERHQLNGRGIGFVDIHLLASSQLGQVKLWTADKRLMSAAANLGLKYEKKR